MRTVRLAMATALAAGVVASVAAPPAAAAHMAWKHGNGNVKIRGLSYEVSVSYAYRYNGHTVQTMWVDCRVPWAVLVDVDITWCGVWNDNLRWGGDWMEPGANFRVSAVARGFPIAADHWVRESVSRFGRQCCERGG
jgi:hypothetical protein